MVGAVLIGIVPAHLAARRTARDELRLESETGEPLPMPRTDLLGLIRTDRASVWRTVPMRRGMAVLAIGPGVVAIAGDLQWATMTILPGLVASGGALLFGVNAWCLDGRGALWRESLPIEPRQVFAARTIVLGEFLLVASAITLALASLRAGVPDPSELAALVCTWLVVTVQVVAAALRWSAQRPFAVDLRSARATPAPPVLMVGYSARLAVSTTLTVAGVLRARPGTGLGALGPGRGAVRGLVVGAPAAHAARLAGPGRPGPDRRRRRGLSATPSTRTTGGAGRRRSRPPSPRRGSSAPPPACPACPCSRPRGPPPRRRRRSSR